MKPSAAGNEANIMVNRAAPRRGQSPKAWIITHMFPASIQNAAAGNTNIALGLGGAVSPRRNRDAR
jgi:hypothetical protein